jgi:hypothetical protein
VLNGILDTLPAIVFHAAAAAPAVENEFHFQDADGILDHVIPTKLSSTHIPLPRSPMLQKRIDDQPTISRQMVRELQEVLHRHLKGVGPKQMAQRDAMLRAFLETRDHLSTDELHRLCRKKTSATAARPFTAR